MKNLMMILPVAAFALAAVAQEAAKPSETPRAPLTAEQKAELRRVRRERRLAESGGIVERDVQGKSALIVNAQSEVPMSCLDEAAASIRGLVLVKVETATGDPSKKHRPTDEHPVVVTVVNDTASDATILVAPEQNWATLNVSLLRRDKPSPPAPALHLQPKRAGDQLGEQEERHQEQRTERQRPQHTQHQQRVLKTNGADRERDGVPPEARQNARRRAKPRGNRHVVPKFRREHRAVATQPREKRNARAGGNSKEARTTRESNPALIHDLALPFCASAQEAPRQLKQAGRMSAPARRKTAPPTT